MTVLGAFLLEMFIALSAMGVAFNVLVYRRRIVLVAKEGWLEAYSVLRGCNRHIIISSLAFAGMAGIAVILLHIRSVLLNIPEVMLLAFGTSQLIAWTDAIENFRFLGNMKRCYFANE